MTWRLTKSVSRQYGPLQRGKLLLNQKFCLKSSLRRSKHYKNKFHNNLEDFLSTNASKIYHIQVKTAFESELIAATLLLVFETRPSSVLLRPQAIFQFPVYGPQVW